MDAYNVTLVGNEAVLEFIRSDWENSTMYYEGAPAPEWSEDLLWYWGEGNEQFTDPRIWNDALWSILSWRSEYGMFEWADGEGYFVDYDVIETCEGEIYE